MRQRDRNANSDLSKQRYTFSVTCLHIYPGWYQQHISKIIRTFAPGGLMPLSGTYVKLGYNEFLLYNNSRYGSDGRWDYLFPVKVKLNKIFPGAAPEDAVLRMEEVRDLLCQIYKFSRMYWKSVK